MELPKYLPITEYLNLPLQERLRRTLPLTKNEEDRASELKKKLLFIDIHNHVVQHGKEGEAYPFFPKERIQQSGFDCFFESITTHQDYLKAIRNVGTTFSVIDQNKEMSRRVFCAEDIRRTKRDGKVAFLCDMEIQSAGPYLDRIDLFYGLGVRSMGLTYNTKNFVGDGIDERTDNGLSYFGLQVVDRMNRLGIIVNLAHSGLKTAHDAIQYSRDPVMFSHNATSLSYYHNSRPDELLKACAEKGGIMGILLVPHTLAIMKKPLEERKRVGVWDALDHYEHAIKVMGIDHLCVGSDSIAGVTLETPRGRMPLPPDWDEKNKSLPVEGRMWYGPRPMTPIADHARIPSWTEKDPNWPYAAYVEGLNGTAELQNLTRGFVSRGYSDQEIEKIMGQNALRFIERVIG